MNMKRIVLATASLFTLSTAFAQNRMQDEFKDGMDESAEPIAARVMPCRFFPNVISIAPFQIVNSGHERGVGASLSWERSIDPEGAGYTSFYLPVIVAFRNGMNDNAKYGYGGGYPYPVTTTTYGGYPSILGSEKRRDFMFYAMPGLRFYPTGVGKIKWSIGPSAVVGVGEKDIEANYAYFDSYSGSTATYSYRYEEHIFQLGMMLNNAINFNPTPHLHMAAELGLGFNYYDNREGVNYGLGNLTQFNFSIGYRF
jgi:hypothetical protein